MRRIAGILAAAAALVIARAPLPAQASGADVAASSPSPGPFVAGRWAGAADLGDGLEDLVVRVVERGAGAGSGGAIALADLPARRVFGLPVENFRRDPEGMSFSIPAVLPELGTLAFLGSPSERPEGESFAVEGRVSGAGEFALSLSPDPARGEPRRIAVGGGELAGSLVLPPSAQGWSVPVALILAGAGEADRDGDNFNVPGKAGSLALLARELGARGVASLRYDKRGVGESLASAPLPESFDDYVDDAACALRDLASDPAFSRVVVVGHAEGALVGAAALARLGTGPEGRIAGLAAVCASGLSSARALRRDLRASIESGFPDLGEEERASLAAEAEAIVASLESGLAYPDPSPELADFFDPAAQAWYAAALKYDIGAEASSTSLPLLVVSGGSDLQAPPGEAAGLLEARPAAAYRVIAGMAHSLKEVGDDEEANYDSFSNPGYPLGAGLSDLVAAFARGDALPGPDPRAAPGRGGGEH
jgi:uncharacterized protein